MLIDRSYFVGEINIPNTSGVAGEILDWFIEKYEDDFLRKALGYDMYKAFKAGLVTDPVPQKWTDLLEGVEYAYSNRNYFWPGLVAQPLSVINAASIANTITVIVDRGQQYDPISTVDGQPNNKTIIPASLVGKDFILEQRVIGQLRSDEYSIEGNELTLLNSNFSSEDTYFFKSASLSLNDSTGLNKQSPIANYIYYWYMRNNASQTASMGEVKSTNENAVSVNPGMKMQRAWNEMSDRLREMRHYLSANTELYDYEFHCSEVFKPINVFNL